MESQNIEAKKVFSRLGMGLFLMMVLTMLVQPLFAYFLAKVGSIVPGYNEGGWFIILLNVLPLYLVGGPVFYLTTKNLPSGPKADKKDIEFKDLIILIIISLGASYIFNIVGQIINLLIGIIKGSNVINPLLETIGDTSTLAVLIFVGVLSPIFEELIFRGIFLDKIRVYGDHIAIWTTALAFGLFHGNLTQFFYAFILGIIFAYITIKTNQIKYAIIIHMAINILGSVIMPNLLLSGSKFIGGVLAIFIILLIIMAVFLYSKNSNRIEFQKGQIEIEPSQEKKIVYFNFGMILFFIISMSRFIAIILM